MNPGYELVYGEGDTTIKIEEDKCDFTFELLKFFYDSSLQAERDRLFGYFDQKDIICSLFPNMILALRMAKLGLRVVINTHENTEIRDIIKKNMKDNEINCENIEVLSIDTVNFLKNCFEKPFGNSQEFTRHIYISLLMENLGFLRNL